MKIVLIGILTAVVLAGIAFGMQELDLLSFSFFAPKYEKVHRKVFEETPSYVQGKIQDLSNYKFQYEKADSSDKVAIQAVVRSQFANFNDKYVPDELLGFLTKMRY